MPSQSSARTLASVVSAKFGSLLRALELRQTRALRGIEAASAQALAQAQAEERRLRGHLEAAAAFGRRARDLLEQPDDRTFLQVPGRRAAGRGAGAPAPCSRLTAAAPGLRRHSSWRPRGLSGR